MPYSTAKPFLKWAGGKSQLLPVLREHYPERLERYCEPFAGGAAVLFDILANRHPAEVRLNDINPSLINAYRQLQRDVHELTQRLFRLQEEFASLESEARQAFYSAKRERYNSLPEPSLEQAELFVFLNKTCYNGLYRVNAQGQFNVPLGSSRRPQIVDPLHLRRLHKLLGNVQVTCGDYRDCLEFIDGQTFVYLDPPYRPLSATASFTEYSAAGFGEADQEELAQFIAEIDARGARFLLSNSAPEDGFFERLYAKYTMVPVQAKRKLNRDVSGRGEVREWLIKNY